MVRTAIAFREECLRHDTGPVHPERADRVWAILDAVNGADLKFPQIEVQPATRADLLRVHTREHIDEIQKTCSTGGIYPDHDTVMGPESWQAALLSAGAAISACKAVLDGQYDNVFSLMRPPGHHAEADKAMGFCLFNNVAIAAKWLREEVGLDRVAIFDWDVHHGNGTERTFYRDGMVYYASIHEHPHYPGTGHPSERGLNDTNLNIQMSPGLGEEEWLRAIDERVVPAIEAFKPDFFLISCGFDAHKLDPLASQLLETESFAKMTERVKHLAGGRVVSLLEGGYHLGALGASAVAHLRALRGDTASA